MMTASDLTIDDIVDALHDLRLSDKRHLAELALQNDGVARLIAGAQRYVDGWADAVSLDWYKLNRAGLWIGRTLPADRSIVRTAFSVDAAARRMADVCNGGPIEMATAALPDDAMTHFLLGLWDYRSVHRTKAEPFTPPPYAL